MTIPIATTSITILRVPADPDRDPADDAPEEEVVASGVRAVISSPTGRERNVGGAQSVIEHSLSCDPVDLHHLDAVLDETTNSRYEVVWTTRRTDPTTGLEHTRAGLKMVSGLTA